MPCAWASARAGLSASGSFGLKTIACTPAAMRSRMSEAWPAASVLRCFTIRSETWPDAAACAFAVQTCSSRKPLPTPPPFEYPILYCVVAALAGSLAGALAGSLAVALAAAVGAALAATDGAVVAPPPVLHAPTMTATAASAANPRAIRFRFMYWCPPPR